MGPLGWQETVFIFILALLVFGPKKLPELGKTIGKAMTEFRRASSELRSTWDREMAAIEREGHEVASATSSVKNQIEASTSDYNSSYYDSTTITVMDTIRRIRPALRRPRKVPQ
ncbi:MAG: twin-arginine translocase TatA/TatE family subunit [Bryobacterales bacterium]|nr:twin-arginine translocase TatA/TatE family subunit [Bryobacterales bacterium]